ncbi:MAG: DUF128 domain-containing protein [Synergistaceae bacterium]|nr:DUF128 domain-containing protein [Synergistaceae bacterium]
MFEIEEYPETVVEIIRVLYFSGKLQTSGDLQSALQKKGIAVETRTIRYHLTALEKKSLVKRFGNRGVLLTEKGIDEAKMLLVFDRVGGLAMETERLSMECDYTSLKGSGTLMVNTLLIDEEKMPRALEILAKTAASGVIVSCRLGILRPSERMWNFEVPPGKNALIGVSSRNYDVLLEQVRIPTETSATFLYHVEDFKPSGITDIISHAGITLSPGELLIRGKYTSVSRVAERGNGLVTAAIKTFPSIYFDEVQKILSDLDPSLFSGPVELKAQIPQFYRMSYKDRNKGYMLVYGGANFFAPLVEQGLAEILSISHSIYESERMLPVSQLV